MTRLLCALGTLIALAGAWHAHHGLDALAVVGVSQWTGYAALIFLVLSQAMRPLRRLGLISARFQVAGRRDFGVASALLASLHLGWAWWKFLHWNLLDVVTDSAWIQAGVAAWVILALLWLTSYPRLVRWSRLKLWKPVHYFAYVALGLAWLHFALCPWGERAWVGRFGWLIAILWLLRLPRLRIARHQPKQAQ